MIQMLKQPLSISQGMGSAHDETSRQGRDVPQLMRQLCMHELFV